MRKLLLTVGTFALVGAVVAGPNLTKAKLKGAQAVKFDKNVGKEEFLTAPSSIVSAKHNTVVKSNRKGSSAGTVIGTTSYGLQSNSAIGRRIINYTDGTISAVWTTADPNATTAFTLRGTGYNYFDGTNWKTAGAAN